MTTLPTRPPGFWWRRRMGRGFAARAYNPSVDAYLSWECAIGELRKQHVAAQQQEPQPQSEREAEPLIGEPPDYIENITGRTFGEWTVLGYAVKTKTHHRWWCRCSCGRTKPLLERSLTCGRSSRCQSCASRERWVQARARARANEIALGDNAVGGPALGGESAGPSALGYREPTIGDIDATAAQQPDAATVPAASPWREAV